jgi:hypothetical protein
VDGKYELDEDHNQFQLPGENFNYGVSDSWIAATIEKLPGTTTITSGVSEASARLFNILEYVEAASAWQGLVANVFQDGKITWLAWRGQYVSVEGAVYVPYKLGT